MMRHLSIRSKITFWFTAALVIAVVFTYLAVFSISDQMMQKTIRDNLIETVEHNIDEIEFYGSFDEIQRLDDMDHYMNYINGYLEIDDDFLDQVNEVYSALYQEDGTFLYGENPISNQVASLAFTDSTIRTIRVDGLRYYVFDRKLTAKGLEGLWLRGVVSERQGEVETSFILRLSLILLPSLVLVASIGGYYFAKRMLLPIQKLSDTARKISQGDDLKQQIEIGAGSDEVHQLADSFNDMFQRLDEAFEAQRRFTSDASHELRTPTSVIVAQCEYTLEKPRSHEEYEDALRIIQRQGKKMSKLIANMLDFTRLETQAERYPLHEFDLTALVESVCEDMALIRENDISLTYDIQSGIAYCGNPELLTRLLNNLIANAYRYGKENGHIAVMLKQDEQAITLSVSDDGIGIAKEEQQAIFRRFYQADHARANEGLGLGLPMAYEIARFHGGELRVTSEPEQGSTFTLMLPDCVG